MNPTDVTELSNQVALVTGASRGIGQAIAMELASLGCFVYVNYHSNKEGAQSTLAAIEQAGGQGKILPFTVTEAQSSEQAVAAILREKEKIDILVNNAGIKKDGLLIRMKEEHWHDVLDVNLNGFFNVTKPVVKSMLSKRYGRIVNITSTSGQAGQAGQVNYSASKSGIIGATRALAKEMAARNITVNALAPGFIESEMTQNLSQDAILPMIPAGRMGTCQEVARAAAFLCSPLSSYITGQVLGVNGGMY
ncbi:MAG: 3-oxoacyl-ACP reductase [Desulfobacterales bacterium]|nr:MAG: 3-oxoacyl-ACP reductase [Desulfobacterales bacterium]